MTVKLNNQHLQKKIGTPLVVTHTWCLVGPSVENNIIEPTAFSKLSVGFTFSFVAGILKPAVLSVTGVGSL